MARKATPPSTWYTVSLSAAMESRLLDALRRIAEHDTILGLYSLREFEREVSIYSSAHEACLVLGVSAEGDVLARIGEGPVAVLSIKRRGHWSSEEKGYRGARVIMNLAAPEKNVAWIDHL